MIQLFQIRNIQVHRYYDTTIVLQIITCKHTTRDKTLKKKAPRLRDIKSSFPNLVDDLEENNT